jgi:hypothetical protein
VAPAALLAIATVPAIVFVGVGYVTRDTIATDFEWITYREYVGVSNTLLVFVALTAPDIMCPDRRQRVLPLLFARPLTGVDYVVAKVGAMFAILFAFSFLPQVVLFLGQMLVSDEGALRYARDNAEVIWQVPLAVGALSIYYAAIGVAVASLTSRRIIAGATIIGLFLVSSIVASVLVEQRGGTVEERPAITGECTEQTPEGLEFPVPCEGEGGFQTDTYFVRRDPAPAALLDLLTLPLIVRDLVFLGHVEETHPLSGLANGGLYALVVFSAALAISIVILVRRYDEVER